MYVIRLALFQELGGEVPPQAVVPKRTVMVKDSAASERHLCFQIVKLFNVGLAFFVLRQSSNFVPLF
jgi:hypothetical protein